MQTGPKYLYMSPGFVRMMGYESSEGLLGRDDLDLRHPDDCARMNAQIKEAMEESRALGGTPVHRRLMSRIRHADDSYAWVESSAVITPMRLYSAICDVTDERQLRDSLKTFLSITMADMLSPAALLQTASQLLSQNASVRGNSEAEFLVAAIAAASCLLNGIVSNVLSLSALEAGECNLLNAPFDLREMANCVLCAMRMTHSAVKLTWTDEVAALPRSVCGDGGRLSQILLNLLTNASKFADGSEVTVSMRCEQTGEGDGTQLTMVVADGGRGMSAEECGRVFESYYRAPAHMGGGTGLGLYVVKRLSVAMGGDIELESAPGRGARFTVRVALTLLPDADGDGTGAAAEAANAGDSPADAPSTPPLASEPPRALDSSAAAAAAAPAAPGADAAAPAAPRLRVLLVDDHMLNLKLCKKLLESKAALDVTTADDGDVALAWLKDSYAPGGPPPVDLVLMDSAHPLRRATSTALLVRVACAARS